MSLYNIEVFDRTFLCVFHDSVERPEYRVDYLSPVDNTCQVKKTSALQEGQFIRITGEDYDFFGVISSVGNDQEGITTVYYRHFLAAFAVPILFDTTYQKNTPLEEVIAHYVQNVFVSNSDALQNISGLSIRTETSTRFTFSLKPDMEGSKYCVVDFYDALIAPALSKYGVAIEVEADPQAKTIELTVRKVAEVVTIEADLPNVFECRTTVAETSNNINKLIVYNDANYNKIIYYLHPDRTYDTNDTNRIIPVARSIEIVSVSSGQTFAQAAADAAEETFGDVDISNLIEVDVANTDHLVKPYMRRIGERTTIIKGGKAYKSILTGKTVGEYTTLVYGAMRLDITDLIRKGV